MARATATRKPRRLPIQIYAVLLDEGAYLAPISTIYRELAQNKQVKERRRLARQVYSGLVGGGGVARLGLVWMTAVEMFSWWVFLPNLRMVWW